MAEPAVPARMPSFCEMLEDPIVRAVMVRDSVTDQDVITALARAHWRLWDAERAPAGIRGRVPAPDRPGSAKGRL